MKKNWRIALCLMLACCMLFSLGCKLDKDVDTGADASKEADLTAPAATVGENRVITVGDFKDVFDMYSYYYSMYGYDVTSDESTLHSFQDMILDMLIEEQVIYNQVEAQGFNNLTEEQKAEADALAQEDLDSLYEYYYDLAVAAQAEDETVDIDEYIEAGVAEEAEYYTGQAMSYAEYCDWIVEQTYLSYAANLLQKSVLADVTVPAEDIESYYQDLLTSSEESYTEDPGLYKDDQEYYEMYGGEPVAYAPEGYARVLHIFVAPKTAIEDTNENYADMIERMAEIEAIYGELAFTQALAAASGTDPQADLTNNEPSNAGDATQPSGDENTEDKPAEEETGPENEEAPGSDEGDAEKPQTLESLMAEYTQLKKDVEALETEFYAQSLGAMEEAYAKLEAGEDFASVMKAYTEDADFTSFPIFMEKGMLISAQYESSIDWSDTVKAYFAELQVGEYSPIFRDDDGYHILYYLCDEPSGEIALETLSDVLEALLLSDLQDEEWTALVEAWLYDENVVTRHTENYRMVGAS